MLSGHKSRISHMHGTLCFFLNDNPATNVSGCTDDAKNTSGSFYSENFELFYNEISGGFVTTFFYAFLRQLPFEAAIFLAGTCMVGSVLVPAIVALRGAVYGMIMSYAYATYGLMGIVFNLLILIPSAILATIALMLAAREAFGFSLSLARLAIPTMHKPAIEQDFKLYCLRQLFVFLFFVVSAVVQTIMALSFLSFFESMK